MDTAKRMQMVNDVDVAAAHGRERGVEDQQKKQFAPQSGWSKVVVCIFSSLALVNCCLPSKASI